MMPVIQPQHTPDERRQHPRKPANLAVEIHACSTDGEFQYESTSLRDFSDGGISFTTKHFSHYHIGQEMKFQLLDDFTQGNENMLQGRGFVASIQDAQQGEAAWIGICIYNYV